MVLCLVPPLRVVPIASSDEPLRIEGNEEGIPVQADSDIAGEDQGERANAHRNLHVRVGLPVSGEVEDDIAYTTTELDPAGIGVAEPGRAERGGADLHIEALEDLAVRPGEAQLCFTGTGRHLCVPDHQPAQL